MSVRGVIPILSCLMHSIIRRSIFFRKILPSVLFLQVFTIHRDESLSLQRYLAFIPLNSEAWFPSSHLYFPGRNTGSLPRPLSRFGSTKPTTPSKYLDRAAEELINHWHRGESGYMLEPTFPAVFQTQHYQWHSKWQESPGTLLIQTTRREGQRENKLQSRAGIPMTHHLISDVSSFGQGAATPHLSALGTRWAARLVSSSKPTTWYQHFDNLLGNKSAPAAG